MVIWRICMILDEKGLKIRYQEAKDTYNNDEIERSITLLIPLEELGVPD